MGKRIAVTNLDWDSIGTEDLLALFRSFCVGKPSFSIEKVSLYPSLYGIEQMKKDALFGPPKEIFTEKRTKKGKDANSDSEAEDDDEFQLTEKDDGANMA